MKLAYTEHALSVLADLPNLHHPSLRAKKYSEGEDQWQARVNRSWRFYFRIVDDRYIVTDVIPHPK